MSIRAVEAAGVSEMSVEERTQALYKISIKSPEHLSRWLQASGREWIIVNGPELVRSLPWPGGTLALMEILACLRDQRAAEPSGRFEEIRDPNGNPIQAPVMKSEALELEELDRALAYIQQLRDEAAAKAQ